MKTIIYYGKKYHEILSSTSRKKIDVLAHSLHWILRDQMDAPKINLIFIQHEGDKHILFVKNPFHKIVKKMEKMKNEKNE
jgi:hypothetical protein